MREYDIQQLSMYFGVNEETIITWIQGGRFLGFNKRDKIEETTLKENALWVARTGKVYPIQEIIDEWIKEYKWLVED